MRDRVLAEFARRFGHMPQHCARAPGRVNLIGDHTDYNEGFVLPMAIDRAIWIAARSREDRQVVIHSLDFDEEARFSLDDTASRGSGWIEYLRGVAWAFTQSDFPTCGWEGVIGGDVPRGAGLSSSAALELATARVFADLCDVPWDSIAMARLCQRAENVWVGVNCGIMDQLISAAGVAGQALLIDCRTLETRPVPVSEAAAVVVLDTGTRRGLVESAYNERRDQCERAAQFFGVHALRDVSVAEFEAREASLDPVTRKRARHVVTEDERTTVAAELLELNDISMVGQLMCESHQSLRDDFEVSRPELDTMVELARRHPACFGARMTGAGFGGCAVALVQASRAAAFEREVAAKYANAVGIGPSVYRCVPSSGATVEITT
jgi:galactokinase